MMHTIAKLVRGIEGSNITWIITIMASKVSTIFARVSATPAIVDNNSIFDRTINVDNNMYTQYIMLHEIVYVTLISHVHSITYVYLLTSTVPA